MTAYVLKRVGYSLLTLLVLITLTFVLMHLMPGEPFTGHKAIPENVLKALMEKYGLDKPIHVQYFNYLLKAVQGDLGESIITRRPVTAMIAERFPVSADLGIRALLVALAVGLFLGTIAAVKRGKITDTVVMVIAVIGVSVPAFIIGAMLNYYVAYMFSNWAKETFGLTYNLLPVSGWSSESRRILPVIALSFGSLAVISRLMRANMIDVMGSDYIRTAKAKGLSPSAVIFRHGLRNGILPVVTVLGPLAAALLTGTFVVELIFGIPGMGQQFVLSVQELNYPVIAGLTIFYGAFLIIMNLLVDIAYGFIDPRIRIER